MNACERVQHTLHGYGGLLCGCLHIQFSTDDGYASIYFENSIRWKFVNSRITFLATKHKIQTERWKNIRNPFIRKHCSAQLIITMVISLCRWVINEHEAFTFRWHSYKSNTKPGSIECWACLLMLDDGGGSHCDNQLTSDYYYFIIVVDDVCIQAWSKRPTEHTHKMFWVTSFAYLAQ